MFLAGAPSASRSNLTDSSLKQSAQPASQSTPAQRGHGQRGQPSTSCTPPAHTQCKAPDSSSWPCPECTREFLADQSLRLHREFNHSWTIKEVRHLILLPENIWYAIPVVIEKKRVIQKTLLFKKPCYFNKNVFVVPKRMARFLGCFIFKYLWHSNVLYFLLAWRYTRLPPWNAPGVPRARV